MNTMEIDCVLRRLLVNSRVHFAGVFAANMVPKYMQNKSYPLCFVINTDPANKPGEHWVACYVESKSFVEFFDSYGLPVSAYSNIRGLRNVTDFNVVSLQPLASRTCGHFCIYFLSLRAKGNTMNSIVSKLRTLSPTQRDALVRSNLLKITRTLRIERPCVDDCQGLQCCTPRRE